jgi:transcriptional regulator with XRE-family HTH domain
LEAGFSQRELARRANLSHSYVSKLENGNRRNATMDIIRAVAGALDYPVEMLLREVGVLETESGDEERDRLTLDGLEALEQLPEPVFRSEVDRLRILAEHYRQQRLRNKPG